MRMYLTQYTKRSLLFWPAFGPYIFAENDNHARLAISHLGLNDLDIVGYTEMDQSTLSIIKWDSLIYPSELQLN